MRFLRVCFNILFLAIQVEACAPPQACAGRCGPNRWVVACRGSVECADCPTGTLAPPGTWSINQCRGCSPGSYMEGARQVNQAALNAMIARNQYFCRIYNLGCMDDSARKLTAEITWEDSDSKLNADTIRLLTQQADDADEAKLIAANLDSVDLSSQSRELRWWWWRRRRPPPPPPRRPPPPPPPPPVPAGPRCVTCPAGTIQPSANSISCFACPVGQYSFDSRSCRVCPPGTFSRGRQGQCTPCPKGQYQPLAGQNSCNLAAVGWYTAPRVGNAVATFCPKGTYQNQKGQARCKRCAPGKYSNYAASTCIPCSEGQYKSRRGAGSCRCCPRNTFAAGSGNIKCTKCPAGGTSRSCAGGCGSCPAGTFSPGRRLSIASPDSSVELEESAAAADEDVENDAFAFNMQGEVTEAWETPEEDLAADLFELKVEKMNAYYTDAIISGDSLMFSTVSSSENNTELGRDLFSTVSSSENNTELERDLRWRRRRRPPPPPPRRAPPPPAPRPAPRPRCLRMTWFEDSGSEDPLDMSHLAENYLEQDSRSLLLTLAREDESERVALVSNFSSVDEMQWDMHLDETRELRWRRRWRRPPPP